jgi:ribonuclease P protein component
MASRGRKLARPGFVMQVCTHAGEAQASGAELRIGYTATKKIGNAVARNRARRRLKEAARLTLAGRALKGVELVLICRQETASVPFSKLCAGIDAALAEAIPARPGIPAAGASP